METQVPATQQSNGALAAPIEDDLAGNLDSSDIQIPRLHLLQGLSKGVSDGDLKMGEILHTGDQSVVGGPKSPVTFIPFHVMKVNQKFNTDSQPEEYICTEDYANQPWDEPGYVWEKRDGSKITCNVRNYKTIVVHGIIPSEDDMALPVSITFKSAAGKNAKAIVSHFATVQQFNNLKGTSKPAHGFAWELSSELIKGDNRSYAIWTMKKSRKSSEEEIEECNSWAQALSGNTRKYADAAAQQEVVSDTPKTVSSNNSPDLDDIPF